MVRVKYTDIKTDSVYYKTIDANRATLPINSILQKIKLKQIPKDTNHIKIISVDNKYTRSNIILMEGSDEIISISSMVKEQGSSIIKGYATLHKFDTVITKANLSIAINMDLSFIELTAPDFSKHIVVNDLSSITSVESTKLSNIVAQTEKSIHYLEQDQELVVITGLDETGQELNKWIWPGFRNITDDLGMPMFSRTDGVMGFYKNEQINIIHKTSENITTYPYQFTEKTTSQGKIMQHGKLSYIEITGPDSTIYWHWLEANILTKKLGRYVSQLQADSALYLFLDWQRAYTVNARDWSFMSWPIDIIQQTDSTDSLEKFYGHLFYDRNLHGIYQTSLRIVYDQKNNNNTFLLDKLFVLTNPNNSLDSSYRNRPAQ